MNARRQLSATMLVRLIFLASSWLAPVLAQESPALKGPAFLYAAEGAQKIIQYDSSGNSIWEYPSEMSRDVWALPNGNILFCYNRQYDAAKNDNPSGVLEITPGKKIVFDFSTTGQVWSCQRMSDGNTLVGAASQGCLLVVSPEAKVLRKIRLKNTPGHGCLRNARQIANGHFLVAEESAQAVREYDSNGAFVKEIKVNFSPYSAIRLNNGSTIICGQQKLIELDAAEKVVWTADGNDFPELDIRWFAGAQALANGNIFVCNAGGKVPFVEISRTKEILWKNPPNWRVPIGHGIHRLDIQGEK